MADVRRTILNYTQVALRKEIDSISDSFSSKSKEVIKEKAEKIALSYLATNKVVHADTLARSSFYIALKQFDSQADSKINLLINNNGKTNRWWLYLVPILQKYLRINVLK